MLPLFLQVCVRPINLLHLCLTTLATLTRTYISSLLYTRSMEECQCVGSIGGGELAVMMALAL